MDFLRTMAIAASGLKAQAGRMRIISENIANADSTPTRAGADPSAFRVKYEPSNPGADAAGNVKYPNVNPLVEMTDMREAQRSYEANLNIISATRRMIQRTLDILKALTGKFLTWLHRQLPQMPMPVLPAWWNPARGRAAPRPAVPPSVRC